MERRLGNLATIVSAMNGRITTVEGYGQQITVMQGNIADLTQRIGSMETAVNQLVATMNNFVGLITVGGDTVSIGGTGKNVNLLGTVKVNGTPI